MRINKYNKNYFGKDTLTVPRWPTISYVHNRSVCIMAPCHVPPLNYSKQTLGIGGVWIFKQSRTKVIKETDMHSVTVISIKTPFCERVFRSSSRQIDIVTCLAQQTGRPMLDLFILCGSDRGGGGTREMCPPATKKKERKKERKQVVKKEEYQRLMGWRIWLSLMFVLAVVVVVVVVACRKMFGIVPLPPLARKSCIRHWRRTLRLLRAEGH